MPVPPRRLLVGLVTLLSALPAGARASSNGDLAGAVTTADGVQVMTYGTVEAFPYQDAAAEPVYYAVHAVQRVETGTVVYLSVGWPTDREPPKMIEITEGTNPGQRFGGGSSLQSTRLVVPGSSVVLSTLPVADLGRARAFTSEPDAVPEEAGVMGVLYAVLPALSDDVDVVDVQLGFAGIVPDVPVGDGLLTPTVPGPVVPLGTGWPEIPADDLGNPDRPELSTFALSELTESIDGAVREQEVADDVTIDISADVLFAVDSAELTPEAAARVAAVAADVTERAAPGQLLVAGHTDSDGTDACNDELSRRRAQAVADVLAPALGSARPLVVDGRGEGEPVGDNRTDEGKQRNRRVSISFAVADGAR